MRTTAAILLALVVSAGQAWAVSVQEVIDLSRAQVGDDIIIAKIKADRSTFSLEAKDILDLKNAGVSDKVILAMVDAERPPIGSPSPAAQQQSLAPEPPGASDYQRAPQQAPQAPTYEVVVPVYRTVYVPSYSSCGSYYYPTYSYYGGCGSYYPRYGYYPRRYSGYWGPSYGFSYRHYGRHHSWGVHFGW